MHFIGVLNRDGGTLRATPIDALCESARRIFGAHGHSIECRIVDGGDLVEELERAASDPAADVLLAGGGDGTISAAAAVCLAAGRPLAVLPAGTMNLFARSLQLPLELDAALEAAAGGQLRRVDIATANGRPFIHQYAVGLHPRLVRIRQAMRYGSRWGKMLASLRAVAAAVSRPLRFEVEIVTPRGSRRCAASAVAVSNNLIAEGHFPYAERIDRGVLGVYIVDPLPPLELARLTLQLVVGTWKSHARLTETEVERATLSFPKLKPGAQAVVDGELIPLVPRVEIRIRKLALEVVAPRPVPGRG